MDSTLHSPYTGLSLNGIETIRCFFLSIAIMSSVFQIVQVGLMMIGLFLETDMERDQGDKRDQGQIFDLLDESNLSP